MPLPAFQANILYSGVSLAGGGCCDACILTVTTAAFCTRHIRLAIKEGARAARLARRIIVNVTILRRDNRVPLHMYRRTDAPLERCRIIETSISNCAGGLTLTRTAVLTMILMTFYQTRLSCKVSVAAGGKKNPSVYSTCGSTLPSLLKSDSSRCTPRWNPVPETARRPSRTDRLWLGSPGNATGPVSECWS